jgi:CBS domain-containing protein/phosphoglycolate phosphatase-like HAD superfamily hydrolase
VALRAIIIRADGALAETSEFGREVINDVVSEAGFTWQCDRAAFDALGVTVLDRAGVSRIVTKLLESRRQPADVETLVDVMYRRMTSLAGERLADGHVELRPGMRDLVISARLEGVRLGVVSTIGPDKLKKMLRSIFGADNDWAFEASGYIEPGAATTGITAAYQAVLEKLNEAASDALVIEATPAGLAGARAAGFKTLVTSKSNVEATELESAIFVADDLLTLIADVHRKPIPPLSRDQREALLHALERLHAGQLDLNGSVERSAVMKVSDILETKGSVVKTIRPDATIQAVAERLRNERVGVMVVMGANGTLDGIISERDLAHGLAEHGAAVTNRTVAQLMTRAVITCSREDSISAISRVMTQRRIRHLPVVEDGAVIGLVSIGDVLKYRLEEIQLEANVLRDYAIARG